MNREYYRQRAPRLESRTFAGWTALKPLFEPDAACGQWVLRPEYVVRYVRWLRGWMSSDVGRQWVDLWRHADKRLYQLTRWRRCAGARPHADTVRSFLDDVQLTWRLLPPGNQQLDDDRRRALAALLVGWQSTTIGRSVVQTWRHGANLLGNLRRWIAGDYPPSATGVIAFLSETTGTSHQLIPIQPE